MRIDVRRIGSADLVAVAGVIDESTAPALRAVLDARIAEGRATLIFDASQVRRIDDAGIAALAAASAIAASHDGLLRVFAARGHVLWSLRAHGAGITICATDRPAQIIAEFAEPDHAEPDQAESDQAGSNHAEPDHAHDHAVHDEIGPDHAARRWPGSQNITVHALLAAAARFERRDPHRVALRNQAIEDSLPLARHLALRFRDRGEPVDDLVQVAAVGLVHAVDGYDHARGRAAPWHGFTGYATPTVVGEIRRHFRDTTWRIAVPRRVRQLRADVLAVARDPSAAPGLTARPGADPTTDDLARHLGVTPREIAEALAAGRFFQPLSLNEITGDEAADGDSAPPVALGVVDHRFEAVDDRESMGPLLATLPARERHLLRLRYLAGLTQSQIAIELGISQMHVSRLLNRALRQLRVTLSNR